MKPITYTNRKGATYTLFRSDTRTGNPRYYFAKSSKKGVACEKIPDGYEIRESVNGRVSLAKKRPGLLLQAEMGRIRDVLEAHPRKESYRIQVKTDRIVIHEFIGPDLDEIVELFQQYGIGPLGKVRDRLQAYQEKHASYDAILRFILEDESERTYRAERMC